MLELYSMPLSIFRSGLCRNGAKEVQCIYNYHFELYGEIKDKLVSSIVIYCSALKGTGIEKII